MNSHLGHRLILSDADELCLSKLKPMLQKSRQLQLKISAVISLKDSVDMIQVRAGTQIQCCG